MFLSDMDILNSSPRKVSQKLGVVGQFNQLNFDFTVQEIVMMNLESYAKRSYHSLSGGEKQGVILARVLAQQSRFLILDEPTNHLDIKYQLEILNLVRQLDIGVLAALHNMTLAAEYCDYLYVMKKGNILAHGKPEDILTKEIILEAFEVHCEIYRNPLTGGLGIAYLQTSNTRPGGKTSTSLISS